MIRSEVFDLAELANELEELLKTKAEKKELTLEIDSPSLLMYADRDRIRQVLVNLIENANRLYRQG